MKKKGMMNLKDHEQVMEVMNKILTLKNPKKAVESIRDSIDRKNNPFVRDAIRELGLDKKQPKNIEKIGSDHNVKNVITKIIQSM